VIGSGWGLERADSIDLILSHLPLYQIYAHFIHILVDFVKSKAYGRVVWQITPPVNYLLLF